MRFPSPVRILVLTGASLAAIFALFVAGAILFRVLSGEPQFTRKFEQIDPGTSRADVIAVLGQPSYQSERFHLGQYQGFEDAYQRAADSNATYYLIWHCCVDQTYTVGFDANNIVVLAEHGGT